MILNFGTSQLIDGDAVTPGCLERAAWSVRYLEGSLTLPATTLELCQRPFEIAHPEDQNGTLALEVIGEQEVRRLLRELDHRDASAHSFDREDDPSPKDVGEVLAIGGDVAARHVDEVEPFEGKR